MRLSISSKYPPDKCIVVFKQGFILCLLFAGAALHAQTAAEMEKILASPAVSYGDAAFFVLAASGSAAVGGAEADSPQALFEQAAAQGWIPQKAAIHEQIPLGRLSFLLMQAFGLKSGLMYRVFPGPRYAFRSLVSQKIIQGAADPAMAVPGEWFLRILGNALSATEAGS